jgi:hypothetical protein
LRLFNCEVLIRTAGVLPCWAEMIAFRPAPGLLASGDERPEVGLRADIEFRNQLDRMRIRVHEQAVRSYLLAVRRDLRADDLALHTWHRVRVEHAERRLPVDPLRQHGLERLFTGAQVQAARPVAPGAPDWLPDVRGCFIGLSE